MTMQFYIKTPIAFRGDNMNEFELPYKLIDIGMEEEHFTLSFTKFKPHQDSYSIKRGGIAGDFEVSYKCNGIESRFECDLTTGNLYSFYVELDNSYECLPGSEPVAILANNASPERTSMTFRFDKMGHFFVKGCFKAKENGYKSGIIFDMEMDTVFIYDILDSLKKFFNELEKIQGHRNFF